MAQGSDSGGLRGPERPRTGAPSPRRADTEPVAGRGGAYSSPPPADGPGRGGPTGGPGLRTWLVAGAVVAALGVGLLYNGGRASSPSSPPAIEQAAGAATQVIFLGTADVDQPATDLAKALLAQGAISSASVPASPAAPTPSGPATSPQAIAPAPRQGAAATTAAPVAPQPAPVVHRPKPAAAAPKAAGPAPAPQAETEQAVRQLLAQAPAETRAGIADGNTVIYSLHVLDDVVEDGDVVEIFVNGTSYGRVLLASSGQDVLIPLAVGATAQVHVVAAEDGGGGVTFGVTTSQGEIRSTVMPVGGSDNWSVTIQ